MRQRVVILLVGVLLLIGAAAFEGRRLWYRCGDETVMAKLVKVLPRNANGGGVIISNARLLAGEFFAFPYQCEAETAPIRGNVDLSKNKWQHVAYMVSTIDGVQRVELVQQ